MLAGVNKLTIQQQMSLMEAATGTMGCGCCEALNTYKVFDGNTGQPLVFIEEKADLIPRACCAPNHSLLVHFYTTDSRGNKQQPIMTMERPGCPFDKPCVGLAACGECCLQEMTLHEGFVEGAIPAGVLRTPLETPGNNVARRAHRRHRKHPEASSDGQRQGARNG